MLKRDPATIACRLPDPCTPGLTEGRHNGQIRYSRRKKEKGTLSWNWRVSLRFVGAAWSGFVLVAKKMRKTQRYVVPFDTNPGTTPQVFFAIRVMSWKNMKYKR